MIDVFEHAEDYFTFLRDARKKADHFVFHIPLDMTVSAVLRNNVILDAREKLGHIHYFSKETALVSLKDCGYQITDFFYTDFSLDLQRKFKTKVLNFPRRIFSLMNKDLSVRLFGGSSMIVLAKYQGLEKLTPQQLKQQIKYNSNS